MANYHRPKDEIKLVLPVVDKEEKSAARISILRASITIYAKGIASFRHRLDRFDVEFAYVVPSVYTGRFIGGENKRFWKYSVRTFQFPKIFFSRLRKGDL